MHVPHWEYASPWATISQVLTICHTTYICHIYILKCLKYAILCCLEYKLIFKISPLECFALKSIYLCIEVHMFFSLKALGHYSYGAKFLK